MTTKAEAGSTSNMNRESDKAREVHVVRRSLCSQLASSSAFRPGKRSQFWRRKERTGKAAAAELLEGKHLEEGKNLMEGLAGDRANGGGGVAEERETEQRTN